MRTSDDAAVHHQIVVRAHRVVTWPGAAARRDYMFLETEMPPCVWSPGHMAHIGNFHLVSGFRIRSYQNVSALVFEGKARAIAWVNQSPSFSYTNTIHLVYICYCCRAVLSCSHVLDLGVYHALTAPPLYLSRSISLPLTISRSLSVYNYRANQPAKT